MKKRFSISLAVLLAALGCNGGQRAVISGLKPYRMTTASMEPTLKNGEYAFAKGYDRTPDPKRGELIVFRYPLQPSTVFAKRVVAVPGDTIQIIRKQLYVNGQPESAPYVTHRDPNLYDDPKLPEPYKSRDNFGPVKLSSDEFFVLGDNRDQSSDSRFWGTVPRKDIVARVVSAGQPAGDLRPVS